MANISANGDMGGGMIPSKPAEPISQPTNFPLPPRPSFLRLSLSGKRYGCSARSQPRSSPEDRTMASRTGTGLCERSFRYHSLE
jgi:hypothetical protein